MTDILLVDDEPMILNILKKTIPWSQYDMQIVGCCSNGEQALEFLKTHKVSLVFTDIKMPHMDGLELIRRVHSFLPDIRFVVLSSYSDFVLVKESFQHGVTDYILKIDLDDDSVMDPLLKKMQHMCREPRNAYRQELGTTDWMWEIRGEGNQRWLRYLQIQITVYDRILWVSELLFSLQKKGSPLVFRRDEREIAVLIYGDTKEGMEENCYAVVKACTGEEAPCKICVGMSELREGTLHSELRHQAQEALERKFYLPDKQVFSYELTDQTSYEEAVNSCCDTVRSGQVFSYTEIQAKVNQCFHKAADCFIRKERVCDDFVRIYQQIKRALPYERESPTGEWEDGIRQSECFSELLDICRGLLAGLYVEIADGGGVLLDNAILAYIESHSHKMNFMIQDVAQHFGISTRKVSNSIYKSTGLYFKQYLNIVRIEKARTLLLTTDRKVVAIAEMVGYLSVEHFSRSFAQAMGVSPSTYAKIHGTGRLAGKD